MYWPVLNEAANEADLGRDIGAFMHHWVASIGFPVLTVTESEDSKGIIVRQDRFLEDGKPEDKDNETIWCVIYALSDAIRLKLSRSVPLSLLSSRGLDRGAILSKREDAFEIDIDKPWKLNGGSMGVCASTYFSFLTRHPDILCADRVLYTPERLQKIATQAVAPDSIFGVEDRIGLVHDAMALAKSGHLKISAALGLVKTWAGEKERTCAL